MTRFLLGLCRSAWRLPPRFARFEPHRTGHPLLDHPGAGEKAGAITMIRSPEYLALDQHDVLTALRADDRRDLDSQEARRRLEEYGPNEIKQRKAAASQ
jgi:magnesium-transporting ATPase (P-type)